MNVPIYELDHDVFFKLPILVFFDYDRGKEKSLRPSFIRFFDQNFFYYIDRLVVYERKQGGSSCKRDSTQLPYFEN